MVRFFKGLAVLLSLSSAAVAAPATVKDIDFSNQTAGTIVTLGNGVDEVDSGTPPIPLPDVANDGDSFGNYLQFSFSEQISLRPGRPLSPVNSVSFDARLNEGFLSFFFDTPLIQRFDITPFAINYLLVEEGPVRSRRTGIIANTVGVGEWVNYRFEADFTDEEVSIFVNNLIIGTVSGITSADPDIISTLRFSSAASSLVTFDLDNIVWTSGDPVPVPGAVVLFATGLAGIGAMRRRLRNS